MGRIDTDRIVSAPELGGAELCRTNCAWAELCMGRIVTDRIVSAPELGGAELCRTNCRRPNCVGRIVVHPFTIILVFGPAADCGNAQTFIDTCASLNGYMYSAFCYYIVYQSKSWNDSMSSCISTTEDFSTMAIYQQLAFFPSHSNMMSIIKALQFDNNSKPKVAMWISAKHYCTGAITANCSAWINTAGPFAFLSNDPDWISAIANTSQVAQSNKTCGYLDLNNSANLMFDVCYTEVSAVTAYLCQSAFNFTAEAAVLNATTDPTTYYSEYLLLVSVNGAAFVYNNRCMFVFNDETNPCGSANLAHFNDVSEYLYIVPKLLTKAGIPFAWTGLYTYCDNSTNVSDIHWSFNNQADFNIPVNPDLSSIIKDFSGSSPSCGIAFNDTLYLQTCSMYPYFPYSICELSCTTSDFSYPNVTYVPKSFCNDSTTTTSSTRSVDTTSHTRIQTPPTTIFRTTSLTTSSFGSNLQTIMQSTDMQTYSSTTSIESTSNKGESLFFSQMTTSTLIKETSHYSNVSESISAVSTVTKSSTSAEILANFCQLGQWTDASPCSASCGENIVQQRTRKVTKIGKTCTEPLSETKPCNMQPCNPMSPMAQKIAKAVQTLGCAWLIGIVCVTLGLTLIFWSWKAVPVLHFTQELSLLLAHIVIACARSDTTHLTVCSIVGILLQYLFLVNFVSLALEAIHVVAVITKVVHLESFFNLKTNLSFAWGLPALTVCFTALISHHHYVSKFSCWLNFGDSIFFVSVIPVLICCCVSFVLLESAGQYNLSNMNTYDKSLVDSAKIIQRGLLFNVPLNFAAWIVGSLAIYQQNLGLFSSVFALNLALGTSICFFHIIANEQGRFFVAKCLKKLKN